MSIYISSTVNAEEMHHLLQLQCHIYFQITIMGIVQTTRRRNIFNQWYIYRPIHIRLEIHD